MPEDATARRTGRPEAIRDPEQLQQARRPDAPEPKRAAGDRRDAPRRAGVLGQLETERAHD